MWKQINAHFIGAKVGPKDASSLEEAMSKFAAANGVDPMLFAPLQGTLDELLQAFKKVSGDFVKFEVNNNQRAFLLT